MILSRVSKWKSTYEAGRKFIPAWTRKYPWVRRAPDGSQSAHCTICCRTLKPKLSVLMNHSRSADHLANSEASEVASSDEQPKMEELDDNIDHGCVKY